MLSLKSRGCLVMTALLASACALILSGCGSAPTSSGKVASKKAGKIKSKKGGGYYLDDGPMDEIPENLMEIPDAVPRVEPIRTATGRPYVVFGTTYTPMTELQPYKRAGVGSWYGKKFHGQKTSSGEPYDMFAMTAAHPTLPIPSYARVTSLETGNQVIVKVNDRGPFLSNRIIDLSYTAAYKLGYLNKGSGQVQVELLLPDEIERINQARNNAYKPVDKPVVIAKAPVQQPKTVVAASTAAPVAKPVSKAVSAGSGYYLQLGAYQEASNAQTYQAKFATNLSHKLPSLEIVQMGNFYKLLAGPYPTLADATQAVEEMRSLGAKSFVVRH